MVSLINRPFLGILLFLGLAFIDYPLKAIARSSYQKYMSRFIQYQTLIPTAGKDVEPLWIFIKIAAAILLYAIWFIYARAGLTIAGIIYLLILGFGIGLYSIVNLRHLENIMLSRLYTKTQMVDGLISYHNKFSLKVSAVQIFTIFIILGVNAVLVPGYFNLGLACAPLYLIIRNLLLSSG